MKRDFLAALTLCERELVRFYRQPSRVVGAVASPLVFWLLMGLGIGRSFQSDMAAGHTMNYLEYFFPGTLLMIVFFTAVFSTISMIEDRREGFMQAVLVAPVSRLSLVAGKIFGGAVLAFLQSALFLVAMPMLGIEVSVGKILLLLVILFASSVALTGMGFIMAWQFQSVQGFHAVMNLILMPMWMLSGALFPSEGAAFWIQWIMKFNPLTYNQVLLQRALYGNMLLPKHLPSAEFAWTATLVTVFLTMGAAVHLCSKRDIRNLA